MTEWGGVEGAPGETVAAGNLLVWKAWSDPAASAVRAGWRPRHLGRTGTASSVVLEVDVDGCELDRPRSR